MPDPLRRWRCADPGQRGACQCLLRSQIVLLFLLSIGVLNGYSEAQVQDPQAGEIEEIIIYGTKQGLTLQEVDVSVEMFDAVADGRSKALWTSIAGIGAQGAQLAYRDGDYKVVLDVPPDGDDRRRVRGGALSAAHDGRNQRTMSW